MPSTYRILGQVNPTANTLSNVYVTAVGANAIVSTISIHNFSDSNSSYSIVVRPNNESLGNKHYVIRGGIIPARERLSITGAVTMNAGVILAANTNSGSISFNAYGVEIT